MNKNDELFRAQEVYDPAWYRKGVYVEGAEHYRVVAKEDPEKSEKRSVVVPLQCGSIYAVTFPEKTDRLRAAVSDRDPDTMQPGETVLYKVGTRLEAVYFAEEPTDWKGFLYTPGSEGQYLVIYTSDKAEIPLKIERIPVLLGYDTDDDWFRVGPQKDLKGNPDSWGKWDWTAEEVLEHVYEPLRRAYPAYISGRRTPNIFPAGGSAMTRAENIRCGPTPSSRKATSRPCSSPAASTRPRWTAIWGWPASLN